jgi:SAM-dependent methyltransferase
MESQDHWAGISRRIVTMGPPQVPGPEVAEQINAICSGCPGLTVLLGVTPAFAHLGGRLLAFDGSPSMIAAIWPGDDRRRLAQVADWAALPLSNSTVTQVLGDGALNALPDREVLRAVLTEVRRVLVPHGLAAFRVFVRPDPPETVDKVIQAARDGGIESLNTLRWRLASALAAAPDYRVRVADILGATEGLGHLATFAQQRGMQPDQADHFLAYRGSTATYIFPDRQSLVDDARPCGLDCVWVETRGYPGARDCPIAIMRPIA